jgi:hypothetical protein
LNGPREKGRKSVAREAGAVLVAPRSGTERAELLIAEDSTDIHINMLRKTVY